jgi:hypothetical protein
MMLSDEERDEDHEEICTVILEGYMLSLLK